MPDYELKIEGETYRIHSDSEMSPENMQEAAEQYAAGKLSTVATPAKAIAPTMTPVSKPLSSGRVLTDADYLKPRDPGFEQAVKEYQTTWLSGARPESVPYKLWTQAMRVPAGQRINVLPSVLSEPGKAAILRRALTTSPPDVVPPKKVTPSPLPQAPQHGIYAATEPNLLQKAYGATIAPAAEVLSAPFRKVDELAARVALNTAMASKGGRDTFQRSLERYRKLGYTDERAMQMTLADKNFWENIRPGMAQTLGSLPGGLGGAAKFLMNIATPSMLLQVGGLGAAAKAGKALGAAGQGGRALQAASQAGIAALSAPAVVSGAQGVKAGVENRDINTFVEGLLNMAVGGAGLAHAGGVFDRMAAGREVKPIGGREGRAIREGAVPEAMASIQRGRAQGPTVPIEQAPAPQVPVRPTFPVREPTPAPETVFTRPTVAPAALPEAPPAPEPAVPVSKVRVSGDTAWIKTPDGELPLDLPTDPKAREARIAQLRQVHDQEAAQTAPEPTATVVKGGSPDDQMVPPGGPPLSTPETLSVMPPEQSLPQSPPRVNLQGVPDNAAREGVGTQGRPTEHPGTYQQPVQAGPGDRQQPVQGEGPVSTPGGRGRTFNRPAEQVPVEVSSEVPKEEVAPTSQQRLRLADIEAAAAERGVSLPERGTYSESWETVKQRANTNYERIVSTLKNYDPEKNPNITDDETLVAGARVSELSRLLSDAEKKGDQPAIDSALLEMDHLLNLLHRSGSAAGRSLSLRKALVPDPTDAAAVLLRAQSLTKGKVSSTVRQSLNRMSQQAADEKARIDSQVQAKAEAAAKAEPKVRQNKAAQGVPAGFGEKNEVFTRERKDAALARLKEKLGQVGAVPDPTLLPHLIEIGGYYAEGLARAGADKFTQWAEQMRANVSRDLDDATLQHVWANVRAQIAETRPARTQTPEQVKQRLMEGAKQTLSNLGRPAGKRAAPTAAQVAQAEWEYAQGTRSLDQFARQVRSRYGENVSDQFLNDLFTKAAKEYAKDYKSVEDIKEKMGDTVLKEVQRNRSFLQKRLANVGDIADLSRTLLTSVDLSAPGRQGLFLSGAHPVTASKAFGAMLRAAAKEESAAAIDAEIKARPNAVGGVYDKAGLYLAERGAKGLTAQEEAYRSNIAERIPVLGKLVAGSERAYVTYLNRLRADAFDQMAAKLPGATEKELQAVANYVNAATGRGGGHSEAVNRSADTLAKLFFSPRLVAARAQILLGEPIARGVAASGVAGRGRVGVAIARSYLQAAAGATAMYGLLYGLGGKRENDPRSSDFGKVKFGPGGRFVVDPGGGFLQASTFLTRMVTGQTKTGAGEVQALNKVGPYDQNRADVIQRFVRSKMAPIPGSIWNLADVQKGEATDYTGQQTSLGQEVVRNLVPMTFSDIYQAAKEEGMPAAAAAGILSTLGVSAQARQERAKSGGKGFPGMPNPVADVQKSMRLKIPGSKK